MFTTTTAAITDWFAKLPRNASDSITHLTPYGWLRLVIIVGAYLLIRPYLMRLAVKEQMKACEEVVAMKPAGLAEGKASGSQRENGGAGRKRGRILGEVGDREVDEDEDEDEEFLRRHDKYHDPKMSRPHDVYFDYHARQQQLLERARAPSHRRMRRWPPFPSAEEERVSLAHELEPGPPDVGGRAARSRGTLDQQPIILDASAPTTKPTKLHERDRETKRRSSNPDEESRKTSRPKTPKISDGENDHRNQDRRYVFIPQEGIEIPLTYDEPRTPIRAKGSGNHVPATVERGRKAVPKLDIDISRAKSSHDAPVRLERERSPYISTPKPNETRFTRDFLLSPENMSPQIKHSGNPSYPTTPKQRASSIAPGNLSQRSEHHPASPARPSMMRRASAMPYSPTAASGTKLPYNIDSNQTPFDSSTKTHRNSLGLEPGIHGLRQGNSPPRATAASTDRTAAPPANPHSFVERQSLNAMLSNSLPGRRRASPRNSPRSSPHGSPSSTPLPSPPRTPPAEAGSRTFHHLENVKFSELNSIPSSSLCPTQPTKATDHLNQHGGDQRGLRPGIRSRQTSPLPLASSEHLQPSHAPRIDIRSPSRSPSRHRRSSTYGGHDHRSRSQALRDSEEQAATDARAQTLKPNGHEHRPQEEAKPAEARHLSVKSPGAARAASVGAPPAVLPPCPRSVAVTEYYDWYTLRGRLDFKICPTCRKAISQAGYGRHLEAFFGEKPERPASCNFSIPWVRMAYLLNVKRRLPDLDLLYYLADVAKTTPPCPGKRPTVREWYRVPENDSDRHVSGFYACPYCVRNLETIFPMLKGVFHKSRSRHSVEERSCSLRSDSSRFATHVDLLEDISNQATEYRRPPNMYRFAELAKKMDAIPACSRDDMLRGRSWHVMPKLPEFTACSECYEDVIWPAFLQGSPLAAQFSRNPQVVEKAHHGGVSCQLYSAKMRKIFRKACAEDDFELLSRTARKRYRVERELQARLVEAQRLPRAQREEEMEDIVDVWQEWD
ncbi:MAG: hypothetical protein Q9219_001792 [cf. Caloplaca sp. 3 TL-2023]